MGANSTGDDITIGEYNKASSGTVLSIQPGSGNINFSTEALVVDATAPFNPINAIRAQTNDGAAVLAINNSATSAAVSATNSFTGGGVFGSCDDGPGVRGLTKTSFGVRGTSLPKPSAPHASSGVLGTSNQRGAGVIGFSDNAPDVNPEAPITDNPISFPGYGVGGFGWNGGVSGYSQTGFGVRAVSPAFIGLFASSELDRAAVFFSGSAIDTVGPLNATSQEGIAQVRLVPSSSETLPTKGFIGDLFVHQRPKNQPPDAPVNLYLCIRSGVQGGLKPQWQQVQLAPKIYNGGDSAP
jgi:hypothetical protein